MIKIHSTADIETLSETIEVECKLAAGKDGKGVLPKDFWESYSTFANSYGGEIFLGIGEKERHFSLKGLEEPQKVIEDLWNLLNNRQKVSANLLNHRFVQTLSVEGKSIVHVHVPRAAAGLLQQSGVGRGTIYFLPEIGRKDDIDVMFGESSGPLEQRSGPLAPSSGPLDIMASIAAPATEKKKLPKKEMEQIILDLCGRQPLSLEQLEQILNRSGEFLRKSYLQPLVRAKKLKYRYPTKPNHPEQAYLAVKDGGNG